MSQPGFSDFLAASRAPTPFTLVEPDEGRPDPLLLDCAATLGRLCHRLLLDRVHSRKASDAVLLETHWCACLCAVALFTLKLSQPS
jgi:hypothetical protein